MIFVEGKDTYVTVRQELFDKYKEAFDLLSEMSCCNACLRKRGCAYRPKWGANQRYNCFFFKAEQFETIDSLEYRVYGEQT